ncbi:MAG: HlyD family efflux transporter periplasmic adaptor subunit [Acidobacteria bacterium]|nr:HlyD family efflux transporter periplasmic adaptor subunit [Acidobacteriota bacterium]
MLKTAFSLTFARLLADRGHTTVRALVAALLLAGAWIWWAARGQVTLYEISAAARVELDSATYPIQSPLLGRVIETKLRVGQAVERGEVLVEIDAMPDQLRLREAKVRTEGLEPELARLRGQVSAEERARTEEQRTAGLSAEEAAHRMREADAAAKYAEGELLRVQALEREGLTPRRDLDKAEAEARRLRAAVSTLGAAARRVPQEQATRDRERDVRLERLYSAIAALEAQRSTLRAGMERLGYEIDRRRVRAPVDGRVGEAAILRVGAVVQQGDRLGSIVPSGRLLVAAQFPAGAGPGGPGGAGDPRRQRPG